MNSGPALLLIRQEGKRFPKPQYICTKLWCWHVPTNYFPGKGTVLFSPDLVLEELAFMHFCFTNDLICFPAMMEWCSPSCPLCKRCSFAMVCTVREQTPTQNWAVTSRQISKKELNGALRVLSSKAKKDRFGTRDLMPCWARKMAYSGHRFPA